MKFARTDVARGGLPKEAKELRSLIELDLKVFKAHKAGYTLRFTKAWDVAGVLFTEGDQTVLVCNGSLVKQIFELIEEELDDYEDMSAIERVYFKKEKELLSEMAKDGILYLIVGPVTISF